MILEIELKPLAPYFLGTDRGAYYEDNKHIRASVKNPYFLKSAQVPSQTALFGILRYLGIKEPQADFSMTTDDIDNIGRDSYNITNSNNNFGRIKGISPAFLRSNYNNEKLTWVPAPITTVNDTTVEDEINKDKSQGIQGQPEMPDAPDRYIILPQKSFEYTQLGERYIPQNYKEKDAKFGRWICLNGEMLCSFPADERVYTGINRSENHKKREDQRDRSGFFKKQYYVLNPDWCFLFYADVDENFYCKQNSIVYVGQGKTPFSAKIKKLTDKTKWQECVDFSGLNKSLPNTIKVDGSDKKVYWNYCISDFYLGDESIDDIKGKCRLLMGTSSDHRTFTTKYKNNGMKGRYKKGAALLHFLAAGSVLLFDEEKEVVSECSDHAKTVGFNAVYSTKENKQ